MVFMQAFHRSPAVALGLAAALVCATGSPAAVQASENDDDFPVGGSRPVSYAKDDMPAGAPEVTPTVSPVPIAIAPGESPRPLSEAERQQLQADNDGDSPLFQSGDEQPQNEQPQNEQPEAEPPQGNPTFQQGSSEPLSAPPPAYLTPEANPLLTPTRPEEVTIVGTQPLSLEQTLQLAYQNNEDLQIALLQLEQSAAALDEQQSLLLPTVDLSATLQSGNSVSLSDIVVGGDSIQTFANATAQVNYDLGLSGQRSALIRAAEESLRAAELEVELRREQLRLDTTNDYYALQESIEQIRINETFLEEAERNLRDTELREEVGVGTRFDVLRAEVQVANARQTLTQAISQQQIAQRVLAQRLNVPPNINLTTLPVTIAGSWPFSLEESIVLAYQNRAELEQLLVLREFSAQQREIALSATRPEVGLFANYSLQQFFTADPTTGLDDGFNIGAQLTWRLYDGGAAQAGAVQDELEIEISETQYSQTRNAIRVAVEEAYFDLQANQENIDTASLAVDQAREALELAQLRFEAGVGTQLDVLSATSDLTQAEGNLVSAKLDYNRALARLERAVSNLEESLPTSS